MRSFLNQEFNVSNFYHTYLYSLVPNHVVEEGSVIELSCEIDEYPEDLEIIWKKINPPHWSNKEVKLVMGPSILSGHGRMSVTIEKEGDPKVFLESILECQQFLTKNKNHTLHQ